MDITDDAFDVVLHEFSAKVFDLDRKLRSSPAFWRWFCVLWKKISVASSNTRDCRVHEGKRYWEHALHFVYEKCERPLTWQIVCLYWYQFQKCLMTYLLVYKHQIKMLIGEKVSMNSCNKIHSIFNISNIILPSNNYVSCGLVSLFMFSPIALYIAFLSWLSIFFSRHHITCIYQRRFVAFIIWCEEFIQT